MRCVLFTVIIITSAAIDIKHLKGVPRFHDPTHIDSYFTCYSVGSKLQWEVNGIMLGVFQGGTLPQILSGTKSDFEFTASLLSSKLILGGQYKLDSILIISHPGKSYLSVKCSNEMLYDMAAYNNDISTVEESKVINNEVFLEYVLSQNIIRTDESKSVSIFVCGVNNAFLSWQINSLELEIVSTDAVGYSQEHLQPDNTTLSLQVTRTIGSSMLLSVLILVEDVEHLVTCGNSQKINKLFSRQLKSPTAGSSICARDDEIEVFLPNLLKTKQHREKYKRYLKKIPGDRLMNLLRKVQLGKSFISIANGLDDWEYRFNLLKLKCNEVSDIKEAYARDHLSQRQAALTIWVERDPNPTYRNLLAVCVVGEFRCGTAIVNLMSSVEACTLKPDHQSSGYDNDDTAKVPIPDVIKSKEDAEAFMEHIKRIDSHHKDRLEDKLHQGEHFYIIAREIRGWDSKPHLLKLSYSDVDMIKKDERKSYLQRLAALHEWMTKEHNPTYRNLLAISVVGKWESAFVIVELMNLDVPMVTAEESISGYLRTRLKYEIYKECLRRIPVCNHQRLDDKVRQGSENFHLIAENIVDWDERAYALKLEWPDVRKIKMTIPKSKFRKLAALELWIQREPNPTYRNLLAACVKGEFEAHRVIVELFS